jgi:thiol-disulfide isomerase/thioredoxin
MAWLQAALLSLVVAMPPFGGWLGVFLGDAERPTIAEVIPGSPAEEAGLLPGDVFVAVDGEPVGDAAELVAKIGSRQAGAVVQLSIERGADRLDVRATLGERPADPSVVTPPPVPRAPVRPKTPPAAPSPEPATPSGAPYLGVSVAEHEAGGLRIEAVVDGAPAARAGLVTGDIVRRIGDHDVSGLDDLDGIMHELRPGQVVGILLRRGDDEREVALKVGVRPGTNVAPGRLLVLEPRSAPIVEEAAPPPASLPAPFGTGYERAAVRAKQAGRPMLLVFGADWCANCAALKSSLADPNVQEVLQRYECVWIDTERHPELADEFGVQELPTLIVRSGDDVTQRIIGFQSPRTLVGKLRTTGTGPTAATRPTEVRERGGAEPNERGDAELTRLRNEVKALRDEVREIRALLRKVLEEHNRK